MDIRIDYLVQRKIAQTVYSLDYAQELSYALNGTREYLKIHLKIDTGMSRIGFLTYDEQSLHDAACAATLPGLAVVGVFTHFSSADSITSEATAFTELQYRRFNYALEYLKSARIDFSLRHCCNSGAIAQYPQYAMDMVRAGIITYGIPASEDVKNCLDLRPVMTLQTVVAHIKNVPIGSSIGYSRTFKVNSTRRVATLPVGYADGFPVALSNKAKVFLRGKTFPVVGRICMDMCMIDITEDPEIQVGDIATIIGTDNSCTEMAALLHTIPYEVLCQISKRVPRIYVQNEKEVGMQQYIY